MAIFMKGKEKRVVLPEIYATNMPIQKPVEHLQIAGG